MRRVQRACAVGVLAGLAAACGPAPSGDDETETDASESGTASGSTSADALDAPARTDDGADAGQSSSGAADTTDGALASSGEGQTETCAASCTGSDGGDTEPITTCTDVVMIELDAADATVTGAWIEQTSMLGEGQV